VSSLDQPLRQHVTLGVLALQLLGEADSCQPSHPKVRRRTTAALAKLASHPHCDHARAVMTELGVVPPATGRASLLARLPDLVQAIEDLGTEPRAAIWHHVSRAAYRKMAFTMRTRPDGSVVVREAAELVGYCHLRQGIAAELITDLLIHAEPSLGGVAGRLWETASPGAQGIVLVDYLDADFAGIACPLCVREPLGRETVMDMTIEGVHRAAEYLAVLREAGASRCTVAFAALPVAWAKSRLDRLLWGTSAVGLPSAAHGYPPGPRSLPC